MIAAERGFLLLSSHLGDASRRPLSTAQMRVLAERVSSWEIPGENRELVEADLMALGYGRKMAQQILELLDDEAVLDYYISRGAQSGCVPVSRIGADYPLLLRKRLALESPGVLWAKGELALLKQPAVALVGSRNIREENRAFAREVGYQAACQGYVLISGNARGADREAQDACLAAGGSVISVVADELVNQTQRERMLYLSEDGYDEAFTAARALSRNRVIHGLGTKTFVAQATCRGGGTWDGTVKNLRHGWSPVYCCSDGSEAAVLLEQMGAVLIEKKELRSFYDLEKTAQDSFLL